MVAFELCNYHVSAGRTCSANTTNGRTFNIKFAEQVLHLADEKINVCSLFTGKPFCLHPSNVALRTQIVIGFCLAS